VAVRVTVRRAFIGPLITTRSLPLVIIPVRHGMQKGARVERRLSIVGRKAKELK